MAKLLRDELVNYFPEIYRRSDRFNQFCTAIGTLLDNFKLAVDDFKTFSDFENASESRLDDLAEQFDVTFPRNMSVDRKRQYLREVIDLYRSNGTERALKRSFSLIGWDVTIKYAWIVDPTYFTPTTTTYTLDNGVSTFNMSSTSFAFGTEVVYPEGTFVDLEDPSGELYLKNFIYGENYRDPKPVRFVKTPYIKVEVNEDDYNTFTSSYVVDGKIYNYTSSEEFEILTAIRNYFLEQNRPAEMVILEIATPLLLEDTIDGITTFILNEGTVSIAQRGAELVLDGTWALGVDVDRFRFGEYFGDFKLGYSRKVSVSFADNNPADDTITRSSGSWITDGFWAGLTFEVFGTTSNNGTYTVQSLTDMVLTLDPADTLIVEGPVTAYIVAGCSVTTPVTPATNNLNRTYSAGTTSAPQLPFMMRKISDLDITVGATDTIRLYAGTNDNRRVFSTTFSQFGGGQLGTISVVSSGSGYTVEDTLSINAFVNAEIRVTSVNQNGAVTGLTVTNFGDFLSPPSNPITPTPISATGSGLTVNVSIEPGNFVSLIELSNVTNNIIEISAARMSNPGTLNFISATPSSITRTSGSFVTDGFINNQIIKIGDSTLNDGYYVVRTVTATTLTLDVFHTLTNDTISVGSDGVYIGHPEIFSMYVLPLNTLNNDVTLDITWKS